MAEEGCGSGLAKAAGVGFLGLLAILGKVGDDCGRAGLKAGGAADDLARAGATKVDDISRLTKVTEPGTLGRAGPIGAPGAVGDELKVADDLARSASPSSVAAEAKAGGTTSDLTEEALKSAAEEGSANLLDAWLSEDEGTPTLDSIPVEAAQRQSLALWTFMPLSTDSLGSYLGRTATPREVAAHERIRNQGPVPILKPIFSGLTVSKSLQLSERLKTFIGYTVADDAQRFRLWEGGAVPISGLQAACLVRKQSCMIIACARMDLDAIKPCALVGRDLAKTAGSAATPREGIRQAIRERDAARREDVVIYSAALRDGRPRFLHSQM
jgi:hypothetical protein